MKRQAIRAAPIEALSIEPGPAPNTAYSALLSIPPSPARESFINAWRGTIQWIARSPFRPEHKRKNWFVGVEMIEPADETLFENHASRSD